MMPEDCRRYAAELDARVDAELHETGLEAHLAGCPACRAELESRAALKRALSKVSLPPPPRPFDRALLAPERRAWWPAAAAAGFLAVVFLLSMPQATPEVFAATRLHEDVLKGHVTLGNLGLRPTASRAEIPAGCPCPPDLGPSAPFVVYGRGHEAVSCLALESADPRPATWYRLGVHTVLVRSRLGLLEIWVSRLDRARLSSWIGRYDALDVALPARRSLREFT